MPLGTTLFYIPRGPVMNYSNESLVRFYLEQLTIAAKQKHAIALRFDPAVLSKKYPYRIEKPNMNVRMFQSLIC